MNVLIMRGSSGTGKSTYVKRNCPKEHYLVSTDNYFIREGRYEFDPGKLPEYHNASLRSYLNLLQDKVQNIVVDNTNIRMFEIAPYYRLAEVFGYHVQIFTMMCNIQTAIKRTQHGVPAHIIQNMMNSMEPLPPWWNQTFVWSE